MAKGITLNREPKADTIVEVLGTVDTLPVWEFGQPVLRIANAGRAGWVKDTGSVLGLLQKSASGYLANLYGGAQSGGASWAAVYIPANELLIPDFKSAQWTYNQTNAEEHGVNMVIWAHDPVDYSKRVEITQAPSGATLAKAQGWNRHKLNKATTQFFYYGENVSGSGLSAGTQYTWAQFQSDVTFKSWTIYRISLEMGWYSTGTFEDVWVADVELNGGIILLKPNDGEVIGRETKQFYKATSGTSTTKVTLVTPAATKRIRINSIFMATGSATLSTFEAYFGTGANITSDATKGIVLVSLDTDTQASHPILFGDNGPLGGIGEVVSMRTGTDITTNGTFVIVYREE